MHTHPDLEAKRQALMAVMEHSAYGELFKHEMLEQILGISSTHPRYGAVIRSVGKRLERNAHRTLRTIRNVGYVIAQPDEHVLLSMARRQRAKRQHARGLRILEATATGLLDAEAAKRLDAALLLMQHEHDILRRTRRWVQRAETHATAAAEDARQGLDLLDTHLHQLAEEIRRLRARPLTHQ